MIIVVSINFYLLKNMKSLKPIIEDTVIHDLYKDSFVNRCLYKYV
jgi:hypothetical protein